LVIVGNSPVAQLLCMFGSVLDYKVCVADPQADQQRFPDADLLMTDLELIREHIGRDSYVVIATMGTGDEEALEAVAPTNPKYVGLVASREKARGLFQYLREKGNPGEQLDRINCPAGLELGGETLPEIALSVMARITELRRSRSEPADSVRRANGGGLPVMSGRPVEIDSSGESRDPVCGMTVAPASARHRTTFKGAAFFFCCARCKESFDHSPESYLKQEAGGV